MQQVQLTAPYTLEHIDAPPPLPVTGEALIDVIQVGICGSDIHLFRHGRIGEARMTGPLVLGHEAVGRVREVRDGAYAHLIGRRVAIEPNIPCRRCEYCVQGYPNLCPYLRFMGLPPTDGALRAQLTHPAWLLHPVPDSLDDDEAVLLEPLAIALHAIDLGKVRTGRSAAILGCGTLGLCVLILFRRMGLTDIFCTDIVTERLRMARALGATAVANASEADIVQAGQEHANRKGYDYVFECAGVAETHGHMVMLAAPGARCLIIGSPDTGQIILPSDVARRKGLSFLMVRRSRHTLERACKLTEQGLPLKQLATHHDRPEDAQRAFERVDQRQDGVLKAFIRFAPADSDNAR